MPARRKFKTDIFEPPTTYKNDFKWPSGSGRPNAAQKTKVDRQPAPPPPRKTFVTTDTHAEIPVSFMRPLRKYEIPQKINETYPIFDFRKFNALKEERERMRIESRKRNWKTSYNCINAPIESIKLEDDRVFIFGQMYLTESASKFNDSLLPKKKEPPQVEEMFRPAPEYLETFIDPELPLPIGYKKAVMEWDKVQTRGLARNNERYWSHYRSKPHLEDVLNEKIPPGFAEEIERLMKTNNLRLPYTRYLNYGGFVPAPSKTIPFAKAKPSHNRNLDG